jgi:serine/threonine protein kinase
LTLSRSSTHSVIHGDLKPAHIRVNAQNKIVFIDFGCSVFNQLGSIKGFTVKYTSLDALIRRTAHPLDDLEAVLMAAAESWALLPTQPEQPAPPAYPNRKKWLRWKVEWMDNVFNNF